MADAPAGPGAPADRELETAILTLEEWAVERFADDGRFVTRRKDAAWIVTQALRSALSGRPPQQSEEQP